MFPIKYCIEESREWLAAVGLIIAESCLLCGDSDTCQKYLEIFIHRFEEYPLLKFQFQMRKALLLHQIGCSEDACNLLNNLIDLADDQRGPYVYFRIQAQINLVDMLMVLFLFLSDVFFSNLILNKDISWPFPIFQPLFHYPRLMALICC